MTAWLRKQWADFQGSLVPEEAMLKTSPKSLAGILVVAILFTVVPAYVSPLAAFLHFRSGWMPEVAALIAMALSYGYHAVGGKPPWGPLFVLFDTSFYTASIALCASLTAPPASHAYAIVLGIMLAAGQSRDYSLTLPFALSVCVPALGIVVLFDRGLADILIVSFSCALALWLSYQTGLQRALKRQNQGLRVALVASDKVTSASMDIALSSAIVGIGQFLHELRNLQTAVTTNLRYLAEDNAVSGEHREALDDVIEIQSRIRSLVERTVDELRHKGKSRAKAFDISDALRAGFATAAGSACCEMTLPACPFSVIADPAQLRDVIDTLVVNATQAGAKHIDVRCSVDASNRSATLEVSDDGPGLSHEALDSLFEPFATFGKRSGIGLGLYLAKRRVELMGGSMRGHNHPNAGAVFTLSLPGSGAPSTLAPSVLEPARADS
jgi:signal transduction histidine kinase